MKFINHIYILFFVCLCVYVNEKKKRNFFTQVKRLWSPDLDRLSLRTPSVAPSPATSVSMTSGEREATAAGEITVLQMLTRAEKEKEKMTLNQLNYMINMKLKSTLKKTDG